MGQASYVLCLLPHQDDELFLLPFLKTQMQQGKIPVAVFLTSGQAYAPIGKTRNKESFSYLTHFGVDPSHIHFLGSDNQLDDGKLVHLLNEGWNALNKLALSYHNISGIYTMGWEGGHPDHDAAYVLATALAEQLNVLPNSYQVYAYNGFQTRAKWYRVLSPPYQDHKLRKTMRQRLAEVFIVLSCVRFRSQWKSWVGLAPFGLVQCLFGNGFQASPLSKDKLLEPPHTGSLLYERWERESWDVFESKVREFLFSLASAKTRPKPITQNRDQTTLNTSL